MRPRELDDVYVYPILVYCPASAFKMWCVSFYPIWLAVQQARLTTTTTEVEVPLFQNPAYAFRLFDNLMKPIGICK